MPRNGSGTYVLPAGNPVVTGTTISSTVQNNTMSDIASALTQSLTIDGQAVPTSNLPMGGFKLTNLGNGSALGDSANFGQTINQPAAITLASAATVNIGAALSSNITISGTTTITAFDTVAGGITRNVTFSGALTLTHNATSLILPGAANITTAAGDCASFLSLGSGNWRCIKYTTASGLVRFIAGAAIASAATVDLSTATGNTVHITGATTTTAVTMTAGQWMECVADAAWPLTYHATNLKLNTGGANYTCAAGDRIFFFYDGTTIYGNIVRQSGLPVINPTVPAQTSEPYIYFREEQPSGTSGGNAVAGYQTRTLNTEVSDAGNYATVSSNQITLAAGTYRFLARAPAYRVGRHRVRLRNVTASTNIALGSSTISDASAFTATDSAMRGRFTIAAGQALELQHYTTSITSDGLGAAASSGEVEIYSEIEFWKEF